MKIIFSHFPLFTWQVVVIATAVASCVRFFFHLLPCYYYYSVHCQFENATQFNSSTITHKQTNKQKFITDIFFFVLIATCYFILSVLFKLFLSLSFSLFLYFWMCAVLYHYVLSTIFVCLCVVFFWVRAVFLCYWIGCCLLLLCCR